MIYDKNFFIGLFILAALLLGLGLGYLLTRFMNKIYTVSKSPDELENLVILEARKKVALYYLYALLIISLLLSDRWGIQKDTIRTIVIIFIFSGFIFERVAMKAILRRFADK